MASESKRFSMGMRPPARAVAMMALFMVVVPMIATGCGSDTVSAPTATPVPTQTAAAQPAYWPTTGWRTSTPEQQGVNSQGLLNALQHAQDAGINLRSIMVIRNGYVVLEAYNQPFTAEHKFGVYSVTKSVTGALTGIAVHEGYIKDTGARVLDYFPNVQVSNLDDRKKAITVDDLLTMRPGLNCADEVIGPAAPEQSPNWVNYILDLRMASQPGQNMIYCTAGVHLMSAVLSKATGMSAAQYAQPRLFDPLGITKDEVGWASDPQGILDRWIRNTSEAVRYGQARLTVPERWQLGWQAGGAQGMGGDLEPVAHADIRWQGLRLPPLDLPISLCGRRAWRAEDHGRKRPRHGGSHDVSH